MDKPWLTEPDREEFVHAGFSCLLNRSDSGAWCGYVAVPSAHPLYGKHYDEAHEACEIDVHGGLSFACEGEVDEEGKPVLWDISVPIGRGKSVWWFGFDCAHAGDYMPKYAADMDKIPELAILKAWRDTDQYRTIDYARSETQRLAEQLRREFV
jgi:hypothetical protein